MVPIAQIYKKKKKKDKTKNFDTLLSDFYGFGVLIVVNHTQNLPF